MVLPHHGHLPTCPPSPLWTQSEGSSYCNEDINSFLKYQLNVAIEQHDHARIIANLNANMLNEVVAQVLGMIILIN